MFDRITGRKCYYTRAKPGPDPEPIKLVGVWATGGLEDGSPFKLGDRKRVWVLN